jgi:hypothetical protein
MIFSLLFFLTCPVYANTDYTITLNHMTYSPERPVFSKDHMVYLALNDLTSLTYSQVKPTGSAYSLTVQGHTLTFTPNERIASIDGKTTILTHMPILLKEEVYLPIQLLEVIGYPYTLDADNQELNLSSLPPYARTSDVYKDHVFMDINSSTFLQELKSLVPESTALSLLTEAKRKNDYISFVDNANKETLFNRIHSELIKSKPMRVVMRDIDLLSTSPKVSVLKQLPLTAKVTNNTLLTEIGENKITYNCVWAAYMPSDDPLKIDISKSIDSTLMRILYEYYRNQYDLKDDMHFSPVVTIHTDRSDYISYTVYSDHIQDLQHQYEIVIYKTLETDYVTYFIDFIGHP